MTVYTSPTRNRRPLFFLGSLYRSDLYLVGGNDEEFTLPSREDVWFACCLTRGLGLTPVYSSDIIGHHQHNPHCLAESSIPSRHLFDSKYDDAHRDPSGLGSEWQLRSFVHFLTSMQPVVFEAFGTTPHLYHKIWNALLKVLFRDLELALNASLKQRDDLIEATKQEAREARRTLDYALSRQAAEEKQREAEHRTVVNLLTAWLTKTSELAQEMGTPLNVILWRAESLLERTDEGNTSCSPEHHQAG